MSASENKVQNSTFIHSMTPLNNICYTVHMGVPVSNEHFSLHLTVIWLTLVSLPWKQSVLLYYLTVLEKDLLEDVSSTWICWLCWVFYIQLHEQLNSKHFGIKISCFDRLLFQWMVSMLSTHSACSCSVCCVGSGLWTWELQAVRRGSEPCQADCVERTCGCVWVGQLCQGNQEPDG